VCLSVFAVGAVGLIMPEYRAIFADFSWANLLMVFGLMVLNHTAINKTFWRFIGITYLVGFTVELVGVNTGLLFGEYVYGNALGFKLFGTPLMIGVNWVICVWSIGAVLHNWMLPVWYKAALGAAILVALDMLLEPVAMALDFWQWAGNEIPTQNYLMWWLVSYVLLNLYFRWMHEKPSVFTQFIFWLLLVFFGLLNFMIT